MRRVLGFALAAVLALTSLSLAVARGQPVPAGVAVICTGAGLQTIALDAEGNPVGPAHPCPDGLAALAALPLAAPAVPQPSRLARPAPRAPAIDDRAGRSGPVPRSRDPPGRPA